MITRDLVDNYYRDIADHPAMGLDQAYFEEKAADFAEGLRRAGSGHAVLVPGDATRYEVMAVYRYDEQASSTSYLFGSSLGPSYPWNATPSLHPDYVTEKWTREGRETWTGIVLCRFMNEVGLALQTPGDAP